MLRSCACLSRSVKRFYAFRSRRNISPQSFRRITDWHMSLSCRSAPLPMKLSLFAGLGEGSGFNALTVCRDAGFEPKRWHEVVRFSSIVNMVALGLGVAIVTNSARHVQSRYVKYIDLEKKIEMPGIGVVVNDDCIATKENYLKILRDIISNNAFTLNETV